MVRLFNGDDGKTHFEDLALPAGPVENVAVRPGAEVTIRRQPVGHSSGWHNPAYPMYLLILSGRAEVEVEDGTVRTFGPGDVILAADTAGKGHTTRGGRQRGPGLANIAPR